MWKSLFKSLRIHRSIPNLRNLSIIDFGACLTFLVFHSYQFMLVTCIYKTEEVEKR